ncbi:polysaccharide deacetylase family protein [Sporosarcina oncorhynchi]|uniref:Polysaccharide deacetylase family protein n=1 Tax=Sporosarcina oncorhynchi TaxID=3056444 RepID=A0ABZ0L6S1_9BACL|nr:polysaccharide deacetylase family protein [Sporosarcina sp. T2O-4]WOV88261.1 polysaccharide deacetylase family protein [Sporosarcina sp. T2O-4]
MKRFVIYTLLLLLVFAPMPTTSDAAVVPTVKITETTPVFYKADKVAVFSKGTTASITKESGKFYHTVIAGEDVKFSKQRAKTVKSSFGSFKGAYPVKAETKKPVKIYNTPNAGKEIGHIQPNLTIHMQREQRGFYPINFGGKTAYVNKKDIIVDAGIPVLMYHDLVKTKVGDNVSVLEVDKFAEQMAYLKKNGWTTITPRQMELWVDGKLKLPKKSVLITFDDGYDSTIDLAYPILKRHGFKATSFLITSRIDRPGMVSSEHISETADVFSYQNHTHAYHMFNSMTGLSYLQSESRFSIASDLEEASEQIEKIIGNGHKVTALAYPYGKYGPQTLLALQDTDISIAFTINEGNVHQGDHLLDLNRQRVHSDMTVQDFANKLNGM